MNQPTTTKPKMSLTKMFLVLAAGLLIWTSTAAAQEKLGDIVLLPPNCLNEDGLFLDDLTAGDLERELRRKVAVASYDLVEDLTRTFHDLDPSS